MPQLWRSMSLYLFFVFLLLVLVTSAFGECTCDPRDPSEGAVDPRVLKFKLGALGAILGSGAMGVALPLVGVQRVSALNPDKSDVFFLIKAFAAGVILATGFIHILPSAFESLNSPCLPPDGPWGKFPFAGFIAMVSSMGSLMFESLATGHSRRVHFGKNKNNVKDVDEETGEERVGHVHFHTHASHGHYHGESLVLPKVEESVEEYSKLELIKHRITAKVLELGIVVHSVIIGISLGTTQTLDTIKPLMVALCFHQFFEGMGLAGCISQAKFKTRAMAIMAVFFSLTTPIGVAIGIGISSRYNENDPKSLVIQGVFESAAAGILIYMALVDLLAADFMNPKLQANVRIQLGSHISLLLGAGCMSVLANWA